MKWFIFAALALCSCSLLQSPELISILQELRDTGKITQEQFDSHVALLQKGGWQNLLQNSLQVILAVAGSLFGVRIWRGSTVDRKGLAPKLEAAPAAKTA